MKNTSVTGLKSAGKFCDQADSFLPVIYGLNLIQAHRVAVLLALATEGDASLSYIDIELNVFEAITKTYAEEIYRIHSGLIHLRRS